MDNILQKTAKVIKRIRRKLVKKKSEKPAKGTLLKRTYKKKKKKTGISL